MDYHGNPWPRILVDPKINDPTSKVAKLFRRRFRAPIEMFRELLQEMRGDAEAEWKD